MLARVHESMSGMTTSEQGAVAKAALLFIGSGAAQVFVFGSAVKGRLRNSGGDRNTATSYYCRSGHPAGRTVGISPPVSRSVDSIEALEQAVAPDGKGKRRT